MRYLIFVFTLLLSACASVPRTYYSLNQDSPVNTINNANTQNIKGIQLNIAQIPQQYDRPQLVIHDKSISPEVYVLNDSLWVSPVNDQIQSTLSKDVAKYLGVADAKGLSSLQGIKVINVRIVSFDMVLNHGSHIQAYWAEYLDKEKPVLCKATINVQSPATNVAELVDSQKLALRSLAALIASPEIDTNIDKKIVSYDLGCT